MNKKENNQGFTLIEIMIALVLASIIISAIYVTFSSQEKSQITQQQITNIQQNIRSAMFIIADEIRMAGYDTTLNRQSGATILTANPGWINFTKDITGGHEDGIDNDGDGDVDETADNDNDGIDNDSDGLIDEPDEGDESEYGDGDTDDANENITYQLSAAGDTDNDGKSDSGKGIILNRIVTRPTGTFTQAMAEGIQAIRFTYFDGSGVETTDTSAIRAVRIAILGITKNPLREFKDTNNYDMNGDGAIDDGTIDILAPNDTYRRRLLVTTIKCRNMGL